MKEHRSQKSEPTISPEKLKQMLSKMRPSERSDAPLLGDELIPAFPSEIKSEHEEEIIDQRLVSFPLSVGGNHRIIIDHYNIIVTVLSL